MNKAFKIINNILFFIIAIILFSFFTHILDFSFIKITICSIIVLVLLILNITQLKKKNNILNDKKYNTMFLLVNIIVLVIFLRDRFDPMIPLGSVNDTANVYNPASSGVFVDYNTIFIIMMYASILIYNLLNREKNKK